MVLCPACQGRGPLVPVFLVRKPGAEPLDEQKLRELVEDIGKCQLCHGSNEVTDALADRYHKGRAFAAQRKQACYGMREYAEVMGVAPSELCNIENGRCEVPEFKEPPVKEVTLPVRRVWDLQLERDKAIEERDWLRLVFRCRAAALIYESDGGEDRVLSTGQIVERGEGGIPVYNPALEMQLKMDLEKSDKRGAANA